MRHPMPLAVFAAACAAAAPATRPATAPATLPAATRPATAPASRPAKPTVADVRAMKESAWRDAAALPPYAWRPAPGAPAWVGQAVQSHNLRRQSVYLDYRRFADRIPVIEAADIDPSLGLGHLGYRQVYDDNGWLVSAAYKTPEFRDHELAGCRKNMATMSAKFAALADPGRHPRREDQTGSRWPEGERIEPYLVPVE